VQVWSSGGRISDVGYWLVDNDYSVVVVSRGSNDLWDITRVPELISDDLISLARFVLLQHDVK
jgi:hypothetical protein